MANIKDFPIFAKWYCIMEWILDKTEKMPVSVRFSLSNRIASFAIDNIEIITEAIYSKNKQKLLRKLNLNIEKLRILFRLCYDKRYISEKQYVYISQNLNEAGKMCGGWIKSLYDENL